jgi:hypothetical protein
MACSAQFRRIRTIPADPKNAPDARNATRSAFGIRVNRFAAARQRVHLRDCSRNQAHVRFRIGWAVRAAMSLQFESAQFFTPKRAVGGRSSTAAGAGKIR